MSHFGFPFLAVGGLRELPRGSADVEIARWCGENDVVWVILDRGILRIVRSQQPSWHSGRVSSCSPSRA